MRVKSIAKIGISSGFLVLCLASFGGNALIAAGHILLLFGFVALLVKNIHLSEPRYKSRPGWSAGFLIVYILACAVSVFFHWTDYENGWDDLKKLRYQSLILGFVFIPGSIEYLRSKRILNAALICVAIVAVVVGVSCIIANFTKIHPITREPVKAGRVGGVSGTVMSFAYSLQFLALILGALTLDSFVRWRQSRTVDRNQSTPPVRGLLDSPQDTSTNWIRTKLFLLLSLFLLVTVAFFLSGSRGALAGTLAGGSVLLYTLRQKWLLVSAVVAGLAFFAIAKNTNPRFLKLSDPARAQIWKNASLVFLSNPLSGIGFRQMERQSDILAKANRLEPLTNRGRKKSYIKGHAHNNYLEAYACTGIFGGLAFCGFCLAWAYESTKSQLLRILVFPSVIAFIVSGFFEATFIDSEIENITMLIFLVTKILSPDFRLSD